MESPESRYASSPEAPPKQYSPPHSPSQDYTEKNTYLRFLVSNAGAGSVIGKRGAAVAEFQSQSGARIQLSSSHEFFPGTSDRIVMVSGTIDDILKAVELILAKLLNEFYGEEGADVEPRTKVRLIAPNSACGGIIGKGGATIKSFIEDSRAGIKISTQDNNYMGLNDRLIILTGTLDELMRATELILFKLAEDPYYVQSFSVPFTYAGVMFAGYPGIPYPYMHPSVGPAGYNAMNFGPGGAGRKFQNSNEDKSSSVTMGVPDERIGVVVGRGGRGLMEISQVSGARIKISDRGDFVSGTTDRKVTITGSQRSIRLAETLIAQKVELPREQSA